MKTHHNIALSAIALATKIALATLTLSSAVHAAANDLSRVTATNYNINIKADNLANCIYNVAEQAGIYISADISLTKGKQCQPIKTSASIESILAQLLTPFNLVAIKQSPGRFVVQKAKEKIIGTLATAIVTSEDLKNGSAADGYRVDEISAVGPWQGRTLQETPFSINVVSASLIENLQATTAAQIFKITPVTQVTTPQAMDNDSTPVIRGFQSGMAINGISREAWHFGHDLVMEEMAKIEVLTGLSGFFYGASSIGGNINYVSKRPTDERLNNITVGNTSGSNLYLHGDFGGQFDADGTFGYRVNVVTQDGDTHVDHQSLKRNSIGLVVDWQVTDDLLIEVNASKKDYQLSSRPGYWDMGDIDSRPKAKDIDTNKLWSQTWAGSKHNSQRLGASFDWAITEHISWRSAYEAADTEQDDYLTFHEMQTNTNYNQWVGNRAPEVHSGSGGFSYLDINFDTGDIAHTLTTGWRFSKSHYQVYENKFNRTTTYADLPLTSPSYFSEPDWGNSDFGMQKDQWELASHNYIIGDDIKFNEQWSALVGVSLVEVSISKYWKADYQESAVTPNLSLIYQPIDNITTYVSYSEGFQFGGIAEDSYQSATNNVINGGEALGPLTSSQIELGAKIDINGMLLTAALFEIDKGLEYYQPINDTQYKFVQDGRQVHRGLEFTATGKLTENLTLVGGFTLLDAQMKGNEVAPDLAGKSPTEVADKMFKLYGEYNITAVHGLTINGGFNYISSSFADTDNSDKVDAYTLVDMGARYNLDLANKEVTLRLNINNLTDERYWVNPRFLGERRTVSASVSVAF